MHVEGGTLLVGAGGVVTLAGAMFGIVRFLLARERERVEAIMNGDRKLSEATYETHEEASKHRHEIRADFANANAEIIQRLEEVRDASVTNTARIDALLAAIANGRGRA